MEQSVVEAEWEILVGLLPAGWKELAWRSGALRRARGIADAETLLRLILLHAGTGLSLRQTVARAKIAGIATISDVALLKRLRVAEPWLRELTHAMLASSRYALRVPQLPQRWRLRVVDATTVEEPGATGTTWRVHYTLRVPSFDCDFFEVSSAKDAETYRRVPVHRGDVLLADRGYAHREGIAHVVRHGGDVVVRLTSVGVPLLDSRGRPFGLLEHLRTLRGHQPGEWSVQLVARGGTLQGRLCAVRRRATATARAQKRLRRLASKKQQVVRPETFEVAQYVFVFTTLPQSEVAPWQVLELYRVRWQIELAFKRLKSLFGAGHVPKYDTRSAQAWIQAKLLIVLLIERLMDQARFFSPWGFNLSPPQPLA